MENNEVIRHVNYASDFRVVFAFPDRKLPEYPWRIELKTPDTPAYNTFVASFDGSAYKHCVPLQDNSVLVLVDRHNLAPGVLCYRMKRDVPDSLFPDGAMNITTPGCTSIELWEGVSEELPMEQINTIIATLKGDSAYEIYKQCHPESELTESEYGEAPILAADAANGAADKANAAADQATIASEKADTAGGNATDAAGKANAAAEKAAISSEKANTAAEKATEATSKANTAAENATDAAVKANNAADKADTAADKAATATGSASTAAATAREQADRAEALADHPPKIVDVEGLRYWSFWVESAGDYVTSDYRAEGGAILPVFWVDPATLMLHVTYQNGYEGAKFKLENGILYTVKTIDNGRSN